MTSTDGFVYGTNVFHYEHVISAMAKHNTDITLVRRFEMDDKLAPVINSSPLPSSIQTTLQRRLVKRSVRATRETTFGLEQYVHPINNYFHKSTTTRQYRTLTRRMAQKVARAAERKTLVHFVEGLGYLALRQRESSEQIYICERRGIHPATWENPREPVLDLPVRFKKDPIRDILEEEFEQSDKIVVYSTPAKNTFIANGVSSDKVHVPPLPAQLSCSGYSSARNENDLLFVGRGDVDKGLDLAVAITKKLGPPFKLTVVGALSPDVVDWLTKFNFVNYLGPQGKASLDKLYDRSTALLLPSIESFGLVLLEAANAGLPVLCSTMTGAAEYVRSPIIRTVQGFDVETWTNEAIRLLAAQETNSPEHLLDIGLLAKERVINHWSGLYS